MGNQKPLQTLYYSLRDNNYDVPDSYESFERTLTAPGVEGVRNRQQLHRALVENNYDVPEDYSKFSKTLFQPVKSNGGAAAQPTGGYKPSAEEMAGFQGTIGSARRTAGRATQDYERKAKLMEKRQGLNVPGRVELGQSNNLTPTEQHFNPETGGLEQGYMTGSGNEYERRELADIEQREIDQEEAARRWEREHPEESIDGKIALLQQKRDEAYQAAIERARQANAPQSGIGKAIHDFFTPNREGIGVHDVNMDIARQDKDVMALDVALRDLQEAKTMLQRNRELSKSSDFLGGVGIPFTKDWFNNWKNFGYGVWDALDDVTYNFAGSNDTEKAKTYLRIKDKMERGEELTDAETSVALAGMSLAQTQLLADLPTGYTAGQTTAEMAPFMVQMAANPASGIGKAFARKAVRQFGRNGIKAVTARVAARLAGNVGEAAILSNTWQAPKTIADIAQRHAGEFGYDEDGKLTMENGKDMGRAIWEGEAASIIENFTELGFGGSINGMLSRAAGSKLGQKIGLGYISDLVGKVGSTPFARSMKQFMERTHWDGMIEEPLEEEYGIILNSLLTGDNQISDLWDSKQQADIFAGTMWFGGMMAVMNTAAYPFAKRAMKKNLNNADVQGQVAFGEEWPAMKDAIDSMDDKQIVDLLYGIKDDEKFNNEQKAAMFGYAARLKQYQGANVADMLMRMEGNLGENEAAIKGAYDEGEDAQTPDEMKQFVDEATAAGEALMQYGEQFAAMVANGSADPAKTLDYLMQHRDLYDDGQIAAAADYYQKNARAQGVMDAQLDKVDLEVERANAEVRANTHQGTGQIVMAYSGDEPYYILGGDIVIPDGEPSGTVALVGTGGAVVVKNALTGEVSVKSPTELTFGNWQDAEELIRQNETVLREQLMQQADEDVTYGSPASEVFDQEDTVTLMDGEGGVIEGQVVALPNAVDGVFVVQTSDGRALQMTADELNRRIVQHNGLEVERAANMQLTEPGAANMQRTEPGGEAGAEGNEQGGLDNAGGEAGAEEAGANEPPATALSRIPVRTDAKGEPLKTKSGRPVLDWHKASVEDAAAALIETTGGDMLMARDTASDLVKNEQARLEKIRKQKPKGDDPIEIAESRVAIRQQEQEQQSIIKQWQDVNQLIQRQMQEEQQRLAAEREAAKSEEQRQREAEEARIRKEQQDEMDRQRLREAIERDRERRNRPYQPIVDARKELTGDQEALAILDDLEPRELEEWVSSLLRPHSMLWQDASDAEVGLQTELGLKRADMQRFMQLLGTKESGAKPFGKAVLDIYESLPDAMKEQYTDEDVRRVVLDMFREMENSTQMMHLTEQHRIDEARQTAAENERRDREAEMEAWAEAYHLTPEERETFEEFMQMPPTDVEKEVINQIIAEAATVLQQSETNNSRENEQIGTSPAVGGEPDGGGVPAGVEGGEGQVQGTAKGTGDGVYAEGVAEGAEAGGGEQAVSGDEVAGGASAVRPAGESAGTSAERESVAILLDQIGADVTLAGRMSDYEVEQMNALIEDWDAVNSEYGEVIEQQKPALQSKNKATRDAAQKIVDEAQARANEAFEPVEQYVEGLNTKYGIETEEPFEGAIPTPEVDEPRMRAIRQALADAYRSGDASAIGKAAKAVQDYVDEGLDDYVEYDGSNDNYDGDDPDTLADQYIVHVFQDRYLDDDEDQEYIRTGLKPGMMEQAAPQPIGTGDFGPIYDQFRGKPNEAIGFLLSKRDGEALGALSHKDIGEIDLVWGKEGTGHSDGFGLAKLVKYHPEVVENLQEILNDMKIVKRTENRINLESEKYKAAVRLTWNEERKTWLLTVFEKKNSALDNTTDTGETSKGRRNDTATPQSTVSGDKGTNKISNTQENLGKTSSPEEILAEEAKVDTNPTDAQKEAGNYQKGHINIDGYDITIENPKGSVRRGTDANGTPWETEMHNTYGYIRGTEGVDGDHIDVYLSENPTGGNVFVIDQVSPDTGAFDEHKVMYGFNSEEEAREAYLSNYEEGWQGLGAITEVSREDFKKWVQSSHRKTKPFAEYKRVKAAANKQRTEQKAKKEPKEHKRIVSDDQMEELRKKLLEKFNNLNAGIDVERMLLGAMYAVGKIERGVTKFADYAQEMVNEIGDAIRPYLKAFYNAVRDMPEAAPYRDQMDDAQTVEAFDVFNFDKGGKVPDAIVKAEQVVRKQKAGQQVKKIEKEVKQKIQQGDLFAGDLFWDAASMQRTVPGAENKERTELGAEMKTAWWQDENRPKGLNPKDYKTYTTDEAKAYFAQFKSEDGKTDFTKWAHPELSFITAAVWDGVEIPYEDLRSLPEIVEAEKNIKDAESNGKLEISDEETEQLAQRLLDQGQAKQERKALFIVGLPAGGKSSVFANPLAKQYGARIIDSDDVKPWLDGYDGGNGAGYVQDASAKVAERAIDLAAQNGDNIIIPRIGGSSVYDLAAALRLAGYDVQLYFNDVKGVTSIDRAASRFAQTGRYLSLDYLTKRAGIPSEKFSNFAEKSIGGYLDERTEEEVQNIRGRLQGLRGELYGSRSGLRESSAAQRTGNEAAQGAVQDSLGSGELQAGGSEVSLLLSEPLFSYVEWKSNDVFIGEKPKEIWNSESGKPMPGKKGVNDDARDLQQVGEENRRGSDRVSSGKSSVSRSADDNRLESDLQERRDERQGDTGVSQSDEAVSGSTSGQLRPVQGLTQQQPAQPKQAPKHNNKRNNSGERGKDYAPTSPKARFNANVEAIKMMRELIDQGIEAPTKDQMEVLRQYSGWGGLGTFFNDESSAENKILRDLLDDEEYNAATLSIKTAYYTPAYIIDGLWDIAKGMGFKGGNMLEGSAGIGNIIAQMPRDLSRQSDIEAVEIDKISGNILKLLYPDAKVHIQGFQDTVIRNGSVDLAITNVPFAADISVIDKTDKDLSRRFRTLHDFCIAKNIRKLREGGIGIFITTSGTMDKSTDLRAWITDEGQADVVGAFRLNNETFGGAKVTSDIIVVRKRPAGKAAGTSAVDISKATALRVGTYEDRYGNEHQVSMVVNDYFKEHPEMMAGEMAFAYEKGDTYRPGSYGLYPVEGKDQEKMLAKFVKQMEKVGATIERPAGKPAGTVAEPNQLTAEKEGRMLIDDKGRLCVSERGVAVPLGLNASKVKGQTKEQCFKDYQAVQKAVDDVLQQQLSSPDDEALKPKLAALNKAYDLFTKRYGTLHKNTAISFLRNDIDFPSFQALEIYKEEKDIKGNVKVTTTKPKLFSERVIGFKTEPQPKTVKDAVIASIFRTNGVDLEWIATKLNEVAAPPNGDNWTTEDVRKGILVSRLGFEDPSTGQIEIRYKYLSGNVREKLAIAEAYNGQDGRYSANIEELRKVVPMDIPAHLIDFSLGSSWIPTEIYRDYLKEVYDLENVKLSHIEGNWVLDEGYGFRNEKNRAAGVYSEQFRETIYGHQLVAAALNNRPVKVQKQVSEGWGSSKTTRTVTDQAATQACAVRVDEIKDEFKQFAKKKMQDNPELSARVEKIYNEKFNALVPMEIDEDFLPDIFEGANQTLPLYNHQKRGVMRGVIAPTMLAHEVGTGKSFTLITTAMEMRRLGTAKKPMIVVQNATVAQMTADAKLLYPNAKVLSLSEKDRSAEGRRAFYAKIKYNDWDVVIVPQSTFERIPDSPERELQFIQEKIDEKKHVIEAAEQSGMDSREIQRLKKELEKIEQEYGDTYLDNGDAITSQKKKKKDAKQEAASLEKAKVKAQEQLDRAVDDVQYFDDLGVDALLVDEAHEYKHLGFQTSIGRGIKGIDPSYSKKCAGLYNKTRSVFEKAGWKNVVFATGTPISNTAAEIWTFMKYLMPADVMKANDIYYFDDFVHNFGSISQMLEFATSGKFKENTRFAAYVNKPELIRIWSQVADTVLTREVGAVNEKIPDEEGGKDQDVFLPQSPSLIRIMAAVRAELERFENMTGKEKKENSSIPLTMYGIAKRAAIDPRLVDAEAPDEPMSKTNAAVKEIVKDLEATKAYKGTVAVFCDNQNRLGRNGVAAKQTIEFNIYDDMKAKLIAAGVPEGQIAIIKSGMSITAKQKVFDAVNSGDIRVVLGSTQTLGTGVNMQERLHLLIHMDAPDRPMDYTQRNGRIKRQGNLHKQWGKTIRVLRFGVEDSLDVTAYQRLKTKSGFIDSIMDGKSALQNNQVDRTVEEEEEGLFDNPVAVLSGSQYALKKNQAERELRKYQGKKAQWEADQVYVANALRRNKGDIEATKGRIDEEEKQLAHIRSLFPDGKVKTITVEGVKIDMSSGDTAAYGTLAKVVKEKINEPVNATVKKLRENQIYNDEVLPFTVELDGHKVEFKVSVEREAVYENGKMRTVVHKYTTFDSPSLGIDDLMKSAKSVGDQLNDILDEVVSGRDNLDRIEAYKARIESINRETEQLQQRVGMAFQYGKELEQARKNVEEYTELMKQEMKEKEAKYAAQSTPDGEASGTGAFDLKKAEENDEDADVLYSADEDDDPIYSQAFKDYFGDWESDPEHASKVVDENGRPMIVHHATNLTQVNRNEAFYVFYPESHFGTEGQAAHVLRAVTGLPSHPDVFLVSHPKKYLTKTYNVYLNIRNPKRVTDVPMDDDEWDGTHSEWWEKQVRIAKKQGYDGLVYLNEYEDPQHPADSWIAFYPEQVKSADENIGTYDRRDPDIRHRMMEKFSEGQLFEIKQRVERSSYNVLGDRWAYWTDLMPDEYDSKQQLLDGLRRQYPGYYVSIEDGQVRFESWAHVLRSSGTAARPTKATRNYVERRKRNAVNAVNELAQRMGLDVEVLMSTEGLKGKKARSKGWFNPKTGKIAIVLPNHSNPSDVINTLLHEGVAHYGLRKMFGRYFETFLDNVYENVEPEIRARIDAAMKRNKWGRHEATEEYLARLAERTDFEAADRQGWWQKIKNFFLEMLSKAGFDTTLTDNELRYILWRSFENLVHPGRYRNVFDTAKDVQMQSKLGVGRYARERERLQRTGRIDTSRVAAADARVVKMYNEADHLIESLMTNAPKNIDEELSIKDRVYNLPENQVEYAYNRVNNMMLDKDGLNFDEHNEKVKRDWIAKHGLEGVGKVMADDLNAYYDKYGGLMTLRWELMDRLDEMGVLYRDDDIAKDIYEEAVAKDSLKWQEAWQDSMASLKAVQDAIAAETGRVATGAEDAYRFENRMHGRAKNMTEQYDWRFYRPMLKAFSDFIKEKGWTQERGMEYLVAKSGLERNVYYAFRDGAKAKVVDEVKEERKQLEKDYAKNRISEADYISRKADLEEQERTGADDLMENVRSMFAYQHAKDEYDAGNISYSEYLRIIETVIRGQLKRSKPKKDKDGNVVSDNYYDEHATDFSGLTETFAKELYDDAQAVKKDAQRTVDPDERKALWGEYYELMRQAYITARQVAEDAVFSAEDGGAANMQHTELWKKINAATKETLRESYESGLIDKKNYNKVREMFNWYIPLRGWDEDKASDVYTYMGRENVFSPAVKKVWGRQSKAENPLAYIGNIAVSTILSGHRNQMKQHFLNYVMNNPTSLVSISESWYENIAPEGDSPVWILRVADTAGKNADEIAQIVSDFNDEMEQKQREGKAMPVRGRLRLDVHATQGQKSEHVVEVQRAGRTYQLYINGNPKAAQALNGSAARAVSRISDTWLGKKITDLNRSMAMFFTSKNPAFVVSNLSRDLNMAGASVAINEGKAYNERFVKNVIKVLAPRMGESSRWMAANKQPTGLMPSLMRKWKKGTLDTNDETERYFQEFMDEGGETGFVNMLSIDSFKEKMKKEIAEMNGSSLFGRNGVTAKGTKVKETSVHKGLRLLGDTFEFYNRCAEDASRFIVYMTSRQMGKTLEESIADAKDVTLNFNRKGTGGLGNAEVRDLFIFVNPAIQALANMYRMLKGHRLKFGAVTAAFVAGGALMPIINQWLLNMFGDDDDKQAYWNLPPWVRKNNLVMWIPGTKNFVTIPLAQEFRVFYGVGEMISSAVMDHPVNKWGLEVFSSVADLVPINPTGNGGNLMVDFAPTMVQPLMQVGENIDFTGKPIWRENQGNKHAPMYTKAYITTPQWMVKLSEGLNDLTGGNEGKKGVVEKYAPFWGDYVNNPAVWNHLLQGYFGGMYNTIAKTFDVGVTAAQGELPKIYQTPVINRFLNRPVERDNAGALGDDYYSLTEERDALMYELRTWQKKAADEPSGEASGTVASEAQRHVEEILNSPDWKRAEVISHYETIIKDLKAGERAATESADKADIKESIALYKQQMLEELAAIDDGKEPLEAAVEAYENARTFAEKNRLRMRIERLTMRENSGTAAAQRTKGRSADVEKALRYITDEEKESRDTNEKYLEVATAENVRDDARIKAAKAKLKAINDEHKQMIADGRGDKAAQYYKKHQKELEAWRTIDQLSRAMNANKKLLGKGNDKPILKMIDRQRGWMLKAIEGLKGLQ